MTVSMGERVQRALKNGPVTSKARVVRAFCRDNPQVTLKAVQRATGCSPGCASVWMRVAHIEAGVIEAPVGPGGAAVPAVVGPTQQESVGLGGAGDLAPVAVHEVLPKKVVPVAEAVAASETGEGEAKAVPVGSRGHWSGCF